ncbi:MAG: hypothetical protein ACYDAJ_04050 [Nitrosotalea sp.]
MKTLHLSIIAILFVAIFSSSSIALAQHIPFILTQSPLKQLESGINPAQVICKHGFQLIFKQETMSPLCVMPDTSKILIERGWASQTLGISFGGPTYIINATQPKVTLYDYSYDGIDKDNTTISIHNQTYYQTTLDYVDYDLKKGASIQFQNVTFAFPQGVITTPGGAFIMLDMKFPDGSHEIYGENKINQDGSWAMGGIQIPTQYGPSSAKNSITVLSNHLDLQAGLTIYNDKIKLLVSTGNQVSQKENTTLHASFEPCDTPYPQSDTGVAVLYMPANSIGKICIRYSNSSDTPEPIFGIRIFDPNNSYQNATGITTWNDIGNNYTIPKGDSTVVYWIKTGNQTGFYGLVLSCMGTPFAVGYDNNSKIVSNDFPFLGITNSCPVMLYGSQIDSLTGIGVKYIPYP